MTILNENKGNYYIGTGLLDTYAYEFRAKNIQSFLIIETIIATGVETEFRSTDPTNTVGIVGSGSDYEIDGILDKTGGNAIRTAGDLPDTIKLAILLDPDIIQDTPVANQGDGHRRRLEDEFDRSRQIDLNQQAQLDTCLRTVRGFDSSAFDPKVNPVALNFIQFNAGLTGYNVVTLADLGAITVPGVVGMVAFQGSNTFISRTITGNNGITVTFGDGQSGAPNISGQPLQDQIDTNDTDIATLQADVANSATPFLATEQAVPDDTVLLASGQTRSQNNPEDAAVDVAAGSADAITFPVVSADSRIDLLVINNDTQVVSKIAGAEAGSPTAPAYPTDDVNEVICEVTINDTGTVVINNADIRNVQARTPPSIRKLGRCLLKGRVLANGTIDINEDGGSGASYSVATTATGLRDITLTGIATEFTEIHITAEVNDNSNARFQSIKSVTDKSSDTGHGTTTGFRVYTVSLNDLTGGGAGIYTEVDTDLVWSFTVEGLN